MMAEVISIDPSTHLVLLAISASLTAGLCALAVRRRDRPGAIPFAGLLFSLTVWSGGYAAALPTLAPRGRLFWEYFQWFGIPFVPLFLLLFLLEYTGYEDVVTRRNVALLSVVPTATAVLVWTNGWHGLVWEETTMVVTDGLALAVQEFGPWYWVNMLYTYLLIGTSLVFVGIAVRSGDPTLRRQSAFLLVGMAVPLVMNLLSVFGESPLPGIDLTPYAFTVTAVLFAVALFRHGLLEYGPAAMTIGRAAALTGLRDGVVLADADGRVVYRNAAAASMLDGADGDVLGTPVATLFGDGFDPAATESDVSIGDRTLSVHRSEMRSDHGLAVGSTYLVHDVTERERRLDELRRQREELETLDRINRLIRTVTRALVSASTREEIEEAVCRCLTRSDLYADASIDGLGPGVDDQTSDSTPEFAGERPDASTAGRAAESPGDSTTDGAAFAVPLVYGESEYGTLRLKADRADAFDERERAVLAELGEAIGLALNAVTSRKLLAADSVVELKLESRDDRSVFVEASRELDCRFELDGVVPAAQGQLLVYVTLSGADPADAAAAVADVDEVEEVRALGDGDRTIEVSLSGRSLLVPLVELGVNVRSVTVHAGLATLLVEVPRRADVRAMVDRVTRTYGETTLVSKRELDRPAGDGESGDADPIDLTDRQRESLEAAYRAGYFEWPRGSTAEEVAETMGVSAPTLHNHLRKAENKLMTGFFEGADAESPDPEPE